MRTWVRIAVLLALPIVLVLASAGCAPPAQTTENKAPLVWPAAPDAPRVVFVKAFSRPDDLGISRGFFTRVADLLFGGDEARLVRPMAVVATDDVVYVADPGAKGVHRFDQKGGSYALIHAAGGTALISPVGLALGDAGEVYVTDSALAAVFVIRPGAKEATLLALGARLVQPTGVAYDAARGRLFVVDTASHRVNVFTREGALESSFGQRGSQAGEFNFPTLLWRTREGQLYVTDSLNFRIQSFDEDGRFLAKFGGLGDGTGDLPRQKGVATDRYGHVYVVDSLFHAVQIFDGRGRFLLSLGGMGQERGEFWLPTGLFIGADDRIYVADSYNRRVQVLRYIGGPT
jgi:DNA-binding beta-propeller fold protein YncE